jgi:RNA polymerase primary sigma factor
MVQSNLRLVVKIAREYSYRGDSVEDLISEGNLGLMEASRRFNPGRGVRFVSYASWWIRKYILAALNRQRIQRSAPVVASEVIDLTSGEVRALVAEGRPVPTRMMSLWKRIISFEEFPRTSSDRHPVEQLAKAGDPGPDETLHERRIAETLHEVLGLLSERESRILVAHYGLDGNTPRSLQEIGETLGCTREWVRQLERRAIARARRLLESRRFKP